jgi:hypothetical protein
MPRSNSSGGDHLCTTNPYARCEAGRKLHALDDANASPVVPPEVSRKEILLYGSETLIPLNQRTSNMPSFDYSSGTQNIESASTITSYEHFPHVEMQSYYSTPAARFPPSLCAQPHKTCSNTFANNFSHSFHLAPKFNAVPTYFLPSRFNPSNGMVSSLPESFVFNETTPLTYAAFPEVADYSNSKFLLTPFNNDCDDFHMSSNACAPSTVLPSGLGENLPLSFVDGNGSPMEYNSPPDLCYPSGYLNTVYCSGPILPLPSNDLVTYPTPVTGEEVSCGYVFKVLSCSFR